MPRPFIGVCGDVHGHLQLALCSWAIEQRESGRRLDAILLCGDVGTFTDAARLDKATIRHAAKNPCEIEFLQWAATPPAPWLNGIFAPPVTGGLGLTAPVVMVSGNHEDFEHLEHLLVEAGPRPPEAVAPDALPAVDPLGRIRLLPSGWRFRTPAGYVVGGIGGIQPGQRLSAGYPPLAYIDDDAVRTLSCSPELDILITHQGPARVQGPTAGAEILNPLLDRPRPLLWLHGHSRTQRTTESIGNVVVIPLGDATFDPDNGWRVPADAWHRLSPTEAGLEPRGVRPAGGRLARRGWIERPDGSIVAPQLAAFIP
jgi:predicted phosphodiesterase